MYFYVFGALVNDRKKDMFIFCILMLLHCDFCYV